MLEVGGRSVGGRIGRGVGFGPDQIGTKKPAGRPQRVGNAVGSKIQVFWLIAGRGALTLTTVPPRKPGPPLPGPLYTVTRIGACSAGTFVTEVQPEGAGGRKQRPEGIEHAGEARGVFVWGRFGAKLAVLSVLALPKVGRAREDRLNRARQDVA